VQPKVIEFFNRFSQSQPVYKAYKAIYGSSEWDSLEPAQKRIVEAAIRDAELSGVGLEGEAKRRMEELLVQEKALSEAKQRIVELEKNIADLKKLMQNQGSNQAKDEGIDWKNQTGPLAIAVFVLLALLVLLKLSKSEARKTRQSDDSATQTNTRTTSQESNTVPLQAAKLFASLDLNLGPASTQTPVMETKTETSTAAMSNAESLRVKLNLIRAYITIEDFGAAREAIQEVLAVSNQIDPELTIQAKSLMAEVNQLSSK
jgi:pilus assembly protein FimV